VYTIAYSESGKPCQEPVTGFKRKKRLEKWFDSTKLGYDRENVMLGGPQTLQPIYPSPDSRN
jgi:hypothetical protein